PHSDRFRCGGRESEFLAVEFLAVKEWVPTADSNDFGVTGGGKREGVMGGVTVGNIGKIEAFPGKPNQLKP
ncbi:MAG: hypothetical protein WCK55_19830, partial [Verrucomicrobiota bacterium]